MPDCMSCPRCGGVRLIARSVLIPDPTSKSIPLFLYLRYRLARHRGEWAIIRHQYVCELCTYQWTVVELVRKPR